MCSLCSGEGITVARRGEKPTVKMIFIDWAIAAAVRLHYEHKDQSPAVHMGANLMVGHKSRQLLGVQLADRVAIAC